MTELQKRIQEEIQIERQKGHGQQSRIYVGILAGKSWEEMREETEGKEVDGHARLLRDLMHEEDQLKLNFLEMVKGVCPESMFDKSQEWWQWMAMYEGFTMGFNDNENIQQRECEAQQITEEKENPEQQKEEKRKEEPKEEEPLVMYIGGGLRTVEKEQDGRGKGRSGNKGQTE